MDARDVLDVLAILEEDGAEAILHGGWGIDAVIGAQHRDRHDMTALQARFGVLAPLAYRSFTLPETRT